MDINRKQRNLIIVFYYIETTPIAHMILEYPKLDISAFAMGNFISSIVGKPQPNMDITKYFLYNVMFRVKMQILTTPKHLVHLLSPSCRFKSDIKSSVNINGTITGNPDNPDIPVYTQACV